MKRRIKIYSYKVGSASAKALATALGCKVLKHEGSKYKPRKGDVVVNWGSSRIPDLGDATILNADVSSAACKLATFDILSGAGVRTPCFATNLDEAEWDLYFPVVCRTVLNGHSGEGIVIAETPEELVEAPLYTEYVKKKDEYRVHVFNGEAFFVQRKARRLEVEEPDWRVRNLAGGFVFVEVPVVRNDVGDHDYEAYDCPNDVIQQAGDAVEALGLDFGAVDVVWNEKEQQAYVLEVNTACGLEERTADKYAEEILNFIENEM